MEEVGTIVHLAKSGRIIIKVDKWVKPGTVLLDSFTVFKMPGETGAKCRREQPAATRKKVFKTKKRQKLNHGTTLMQISKSKY